MTIEKIYSRTPGTAIEHPLFTVSVSAGFPSPADDHVDRKLDLNDYLIQHPSATFFVRVSGDSMTGAGIHNGDLLVVDRAVEAKDGSIVVAVLNGEFTVKRLKRQKDAVLLLPENSNYKPIAVSSDMGFEVWGVVTGLVRKWG